MGDETAPMTTVVRPRGTLDPRLAWGLAAATIALVPATGLGRALTTGSVVDPGEDLATVVLLLGLIAALHASPCLVGAFLSARVPDNWIGPLLLLAGVLAAVAFADEQYVQLGQQAAPAWPGIPLALALSDVVYYYPIVVTLVGVPLLFPGGHPASRRERIVGGTALMAVISISLAGPFQARPVGPADAPNTLAIADQTPLLDAVISIGAITLLGCFVFAAHALWRRFRGPDPVVRQQTKWLLATVIPATVAFLVAAVLPVPEPVANAAFVVGLLATIALPIAIGFAITRYRLYEIDRIVSRTLSWTLVSGVLISVFALLVVAFQAALAGFTQQSSTPAVAASTLIAFALFQPVRRRVQSTVDRRFDRSRYDAQRTAEAFAERLRDEVDLTTVVRDLSTAVEDVLRPQTLTLWLRESHE